MYVRISGEGGECWEHRAVLWYDSLYWVNVLDYTQDYRSVNVKGIKLGRKERHVLERVLCGVIGFFGS